MYCHKTSIRVRYGETDQMGYLHHGNYPLYYEVGRVECMRSLGQPYASLEKSGILMPVLSLDCKFFKPVYYDEELTIETSISKMPKTRILFQYDLYKMLDGQAILANRGHTELCFVKADTRKPLFCPEGITKALSAYISTEKDGF